MGGRKHKQQQVPDRLATIDIFNLVLFTLHRGYWLFVDFFSRFLDQFSTAEKKKMGHFPAAVVIKDK